MPKKMKNIDSINRAESREVRGGDKTFLLFQLLTFILFFLFSVFFVALQFPAFAVSKDSSTQATVKVSSFFSIEIASSPLPVSDFGGASVGQWLEIPKTGNYANAVICKSNNANKWFLKIKANSPFFYSTYTIPISNFKWMSVYAMEKKDSHADLSEGLSHKPAQGYVDFSLIDELVYTSGKASLVNDNNNLPDGTEIQFKYALMIPDNLGLPAGSYTTTVLYTMTE